MNTLVSAHNCIFGNRNLGIYGGALRDWTELQHSYECYFIVDDMVGFLTQPIDTRTYADKAQVVAGDFLRAGVRANKANLVLMSEIPEIYELATLLATVVDIGELSDRYKSSINGVMTSEQRAQLGLPANPSVAEVFYSYVVISAYALGLRADVWQGGEQVQANCQVMSEIANNFNKKVRSKILRAPKFLAGSEPSVPGADGKHMTYVNQLPLGASEEEIRAQVSRIADSAVAASWLRVLGQKKQAARIAEAPLDEDGRAMLIGSLLKQLAPFRESTITNLAVLKALARGTKKARETMRDTLSAVRQSMGIKSYLSIAVKARVV